MLLSRALPSIVSRTVTVDQLFRSAVWTSCGVQPVNPLVDAVPCATAPSHGGGDDECYQALVCRNGAWRDCRRSGLSTDYAQFSQRRLVFHRVVRRARRWFWSYWQEQVEELRRRDRRGLRRPDPMVFSGIQGTLVFHTNRWSGARSQLHQARRIITLILAPSGGGTSQKSPCVKAPTSTGVSLQQSAISSVHAVLTSHQAVLMPRSLSLSL